MEHMKTVEASKELAGARALKDLDKAIENVRMELSNLENRVIAVIEPEPPTPPTTGGVAKNPCPACGPVVDRLSGFRVDLGLVADRIRAIAARLEF